MANTVIGNDVDPSFLKDVIVSELVTNEFRAQRSLRVLRHQESRVSTLEDELSGKSNMLQQLQESHSNLMEVHRYQEEVQELQRQLIKLQEIQYLKEVSQLETDGNDNDGHEIFQPNELNDSKFNSPEFSARESNSSGNTNTSNNASRNDRSATDNAILSKRESQRMKFRLWESGLGSIGKLLLQHSSDSDGTNFGSNSKTFAETACKTNSSFVGHKIGARENEENLSTERTSTFDDDDEKISILKEALSSHRQSIQDLSVEVLQLRKEKSELLSYVKSMFDWRDHIENLLVMPCEYPQGKNSTKEISVIMPVCDKGHNTYYKYLCNDTNTNEPVSNSTIPSKHVRLNLMTDSTSNTNVSSQNSGSGMDEELKKYYCEETTDSKMKIRSRRLWETACRFFTPQQAHFILTTPLNPSDQEYDSSSAVSE